MRPTEASPQRDGRRLTGKASDTAREEFGFVTQRDALAFIGAGLEALQDAGCGRPLEKNPFNVPVMVDAYSFSTGEKIGYLAFYFSPKTKKWIVKSFELASGSPLTFRPFAFHLPPTED